MKRLLFSLLFIAVGLFVADRLVGEAMWWVTQHTNDISTPKIKYLACDADEDFIAMGTSRCNSHYVSAILEDSLGLTCYNGGIDASDNIYSHYLLLQLLLRHHTPKAICLEVRGSDFYSQPAPFEQTSFFAPYFGQDAQADSIFRLAGTYHLYRWCHTLRYNARAIYNIVGMAHSPYSAFEKGYMPWPEPQHSPKSPGAMKVEEGQAVDQQKLKYLLRFAEQCRSRGIKLFFCISPHFSVVEDDYYRPLRDFARENSITLIDYHSQGLFLDHPEYFKDEAHMWDKGSRQFSQRLGHDLRALQRE